MKEAHVSVVDLIISEVENRWATGESSRWQLKPEALFWFEQESGLTALYVLWHRAASEQPVPRKNDFDPIKALSVYDSAECGVIRVKGRAGREFHRRDTVYLSFEAAHQNAYERECLECDLQSVLMNPGASYHHVDQVIDGKAERYSRLLLPVTDGGGEIVEVMVAENREIASIAVRLDQ